MKTPLLVNNNFGQMEMFNNTNIERGVVCFDFSRHTPDVFIAGLEGGLVVQCSTLGASQLKGHSKEEPLYDPVYKYYEPHKGDIISIKFSPDHGDMFVTSGNDAEIRIYLIGQVSK